jgi:hypothetical protein
MNRPHCRSDEARSALEELSIGKIRCRIVVVLIDLFVMTSMEKTSTSSASGPASIVFRRHDCRAPF